MTNADLLWTGLFRTIKNKILLKIQKFSSNKLHLKQLSAILFRDQSVKKWHAECQQGKSEGFDSCDRPSIVTSNWIQIVDFWPMWPGNFMEDLENNRVPLLYYVKLCASLQSHRWIQTRITVRKPQIWVKIGDFFPPVTSKFDRSQLALRRWANVGIGRHRRDRQPT